MYKMAGNFENVIEMDCIRNCGMIFIMVIVNLEVLYWSIFWLPISKWITQGSLIIN